MTGIARVGIDVAGGTIIGNLAPNVYLEGYNIAVIGAQVASHGIAPHSSPVMVQGSSDVFANGISVCRQGDAASCGHTASGSSIGFAN